jgi:hypothetical protein
MVAKATVVATIGIVIGVFIMRISFSCVTFCQAQPEVLLRASGRRHFLVNSAKRIACMNVYVAAWA